MFRKNRPANLTHLSKNRKYKRRQIDMLPKSIVYPCKIRINFTFFFRHFVVLELIRAAKWQLYGAEGYG